GLVGVANEPHDVGIVLTEVPEHELIALQVGVRCLLGDRHGYLIPSAPKSDRRGRLLTCPPTIAPDTPPETCALYLPAVADEVERPAHNAGTGPDNPRLAEIPTSTAICHW